MFSAVLLMQEPLQPFEKPSGFGFRLRVKLTRVLVYTLTPQRSRSYFVHLNPRVSQNVQIKSISARSRQNSNLDSRIRLQVECKQLAETRGSGIFATGIESLTNIQTEYFRGLCRPDLQSMPRSGAQ